MAFVAWRFAYGGGASSAVALGDVSTLRALGDYVRTGVAHAVGAVTGLEDQVGLVLAVALLGDRLAPPGAPSAPHRGGGGCTGLVTAYAVTGLARAQLGTEQATAARYVYTAAPFLLLMACAWLGTLAPLEARRLRVTLTVSVVLAVALVGQPDGDPVVAAVLPRAGTGDQGRGRPSSSGMAVRQPSLPTSRSPAGPTSRTEGLPPPGRPAELLDRYGSPLDDPLSGDTSSPPAMEERALLWLVDPAFRVAPADGLPDGLAPLRSPTRWT